MTFIDVSGSKWFLEKNEMWAGRAMALEVKEVLLEKRTEFQDLIVFDSVSNGRVLVLDGVLQVTDDQFSYAEMMAHLPMMAHEEPKRVLIVGGGDGAVLTEVLRHRSVKQVVMCELDVGVVEASKEWYPEWAHSFEDPRFTLELKDGAQYVVDHPKSFDVIICDSSDPVGPAHVLFEDTFYNGMHGALRKGGMVCTQGESMWLHQELIGKVLGFGRKIFSDCRYATISIPTYPSGMIGAIVATKKGKKVSKPRHSLKDAMGKKQAKQLRYYTEKVHRAAFKLPQFMKKSL